MQQHLLQWTRSGHEVPPDGIRASANSSGQIRQPERDRHPLNCRWFSQVRGTEVHGENFAYESFNSTNHQLTAKYCAERISFAVASRPKSSAVGADRDRPPSSAHARTPCAEHLQNTVSQLPLPSPETDNLQQPPMALPSIASKRALTATPPNAEKPFRLPELTTR